MNPSSNQRDVKTWHCVLAFGIPISREEFLDALAMPSSRKSYANSFDGGWNSYRSSRFLVTFNRLKPEFKRLKVNLLPNLTLDKFGELLRNDRYSVITIFSHWDDDQLEFGGGFAEIPEIIARVPVDYDGVIDLSVCHPIPLVEGLISRPHRKYQVRSNFEKASPRIWLHFYHLLYANLLLQDLTFAEAFEKTVEEFREQFERNTA